MELAGFTPDRTVTASFCGALVLAAAFLISLQCRKCTLRIEHRWHALSAGVAAAYVFVNVMPELEEHRAAVTESAIVGLLDLEKRIYLWALAGFIAFAGLSRLGYPRADGVRHRALLFRGTLAGYALYVLLIGYLLVRREDSSLLSLGLYVFAIGLHLFMVDGEMAENFEQRYRRRDSLMLACCALLGWALGTADPLPDAVTSRLFAFLAGGVLITSVHAEIRAEEGSRFWWFVGGSVAYACILMLI
jgi:hypothetical protein